MAPLKNPKERFSNRVDNYIKYRPEYPAEILNFLRDEINFSSSFIVADIGSGTGILSKLFLENGNFVLGIEPNAEMREAGEVQLKDYTLFKSVNGSSEDTGLENNSIDLISAGQAFHWFNIEKSKQEFKRIIKKNGYITLIWNSRRTKSSVFLGEYEDLLLRYSAEYKTVDHKNVDEKILNKFFDKYKLKIFNNYQLFDFEGLKGRLLSSSYAPMPDHPNYNQMIDELERIFNFNAVDGKVKFEYGTELYYGTL